jgi:hypothetical protein
MTTFTTQDRIEVELQKAYRRGQLDERQACIDRVLDEIKCWPNNFDNQSLIRICAMRIEVYGREDDGLEPIPFADWVQHSNDTVTKVIPKDDGNE